MTTTFLILNIVLALIAMGSVGAMLYLSHNLPTSAPNSDELWGTDDAWVASDPLPLRQVVDHEQEQEIARAA